MPRKVAIVLLVFVGISALAGSVPMLLDPTGITNGFPDGLLEKSPFHNYLIPGLTLFIVISLNCFVVSIMAWKKYEHYPLWIILQGVLLCGWIVFQIYFIREFNLLQVIYGGAGIILIVLGWKLYNKRIRTINESTG